MHHAGLRAQNERIFAIGRTADIADAWETHPMAPGVGARSPGGGLDDASRVAAVSGAPQQQPVLAASGWNGGSSLIWAPQEVEAELGKEGGAGVQARAATGATGRVRGKAFKGGTPRGSHVTRVNGASAAVPDADGITRELVSAAFQGPGRALHRPQSRPVSFASSHEAVSGAEQTGSNLSDHRTNSNGDGAEMRAAVATEAQAEAGAQDPSPRILPRPWLMKTRATCSARSTHSPVSLETAGLAGRGNGHLAGVPALAPDDGACPEERNSWRLRMRVGDVASRRPEVEGDAVAPGAGRAEVGVSGESSGEGVAGCSSPGAVCGDAPGAGPAGGGRGQAQNAAKRIGLSASVVGSSNGVAREKMAPDDNDGATGAGDVTVSPARDDSLPNGTNRADIDGRVVGAEGAEARKHVRGTMETAGCLKVGEPPGAMTGSPRREDTGGSGRVEACHEAEQDKDEYLAGISPGASDAESEDRDEYVNEAPKTLPSTDSGCSDQQTFSGRVASSNGGGGDDAAASRERGPAGQGQEVAVGANSEVDGTVLRETPPCRPEPLQDATAGGSSHHRASSNKIPSARRVPEMRVTVFTPRGAVDAWPSPHGELSPGISVAEAAALMGSRSGRQFASGSSLGTNAPPVAVEPEHAAGGSVQASSPHHELLDPAHHSNSWPVIESSLDDIGTEATGRRASSGPIELGMGTAAVTTIGSRVVSMSAAAGVDDFLSPSLSVDAPGVAGLRRAASEGSIFTSSSRGLCAEEEALVAGGNYDAAAADDILLEEDLSDDEPRAASPDRRWEGATAVASSPGASADSKAHLEDEAVVVVTVPCDAVVDGQVRSGGAGASTKPGVAADGGSVSGVGEAGSRQEAGRVAGNGDIDGNRHGAGAGRCCTVS